MTDLRLFSLRKTLFISIILGIIAVAVMTQGGFNGDDGDTTKTTTTSSTTTNTTSTTTTSTSDLTGTTNTSRFAEVNDGKSATQATMTEDADAGFNQPSMGSLNGDSIRSVFRVGAQFLIMSSMFFGLMIAGYTMVYNPEDLRSYVNQSLQLAGYQSIVSSWGKIWEFAPGCQIKIRGLVNPEMQITLPLDNQVLEYGFRIVGDLAETSCHLEQLPVKLQLIQLYLDAMQNE
ncbi:MAG: hypothetical protein ACXAB7_04480 [Candidatus Kariarchaeaceae archaeon]|jgi:hypothetical protein